MGSYERAPVIECESRIDGKLVRVRHAEEGDSVFMERMMKDMGVAPTGIDYTGCVVAEQEGKLIGFGAARKAGAGRTSFSIYVDERHGYLAELIVKHLVEYPK